MRGWVSVVSGCVEDMRGCVDVIREYADDDVREVCG